MKVAIVVPWVPEIKGISLAITIAKYLSKNGAYVEFVVHKLDGRFKLEIGSMLGSTVVFRYLNESPKERISRLNYLKYQFLSKIDKELAEYLMEGHRDLILVVSDEGHNIAKFLRKYASDNEMETPVIGLLVQELIDYSFMPGVYQSYPVLRLLLSPLKFIFHRIEENKLRSFDFLYSNSQWTANNLKKLYGLDSRMIVSLVDDELFPNVDKPFDQRDGIVVPTASLDKKRIKVIMKLISEGVHITTYGKKKVLGAKNLGFLPRNKMIEVISDAKAMLFLFDYEALGLIPIESLLIGTPVITEDKQGPSLCLKNCQCVKLTHGYSETLKICKSFQEEKNVKMFDSWSQNCSIKFAASKNADSLYKDLYMIYKGGQ